MVDAPDDSARKVKAEPIGNLFGRPEQGKALADIIAFKAAFRERRASVVTPAGYGQAVRPPVVIVCAVGGVFGIFGAVSLKLAADCGLAASERSGYLCVAETLFQKFL